MSSLKGAVAALAWLLAATVASAQTFDWRPVAEESVVEILTSDADGDLRETPVWIVVIDGAAYVRTNDSKWLANIRRGSLVRLRVRDVESAVAATEPTEDGIAQRVEEAFKAKYGITQRVMSFFRTTEPTVLRLTPLSS